MDQPSEPTEAEVDAVIAEFNGDVRALLHDLAVLASDFAASVSRGYVRGRQPGASTTPRNQKTGTE